MKKIPFVDLKAQYKPIKKQIKKAIDEVLDSAYFVLGPKVEEFEKNFSKFLGVKATVAVSSGTDALVTALRVLAIGPGDEVITTAHTFFATVEAILLVGATPVLVDIDEKTHLIEVSQIEKKITSKTKAIIPVHLYGASVDMDPLMKIAKKHKLYVIEDACQAHGSEYKGKKLGSIGHMGAFSFYPGKNLGTYGEGGAVSTNDSALAENARMIRNHGMNKKYHHDVLGANFRMSAIEGAVLNVKLRHLKAWNEARRKNAALYHKHLSGISGLRIVDEPKHSKNNYHLFVVEVEKREELINYLHGKGIETGIHYPIPVHLQKAYIDLGFPNQSFPITEKIAKRILSLPMYPELKKDQIAYIAKAIKDFYR